MVRSPSEKYHEHDPIQANKNVQHKEALMLALGSILTPVRLKLLSLSLLASHLPSSSTPEEKTLYAVFALIIRHSKSCASCMVYAIIFAPNTNLWR